MILLCFAALILIPVALLIVDLIIFFLIPLSFFDALSKKQKLSVEVPNSERPGEGHGPIHRNAKMADTLFDKAYGGVMTLWDNFQLGVKTSSDKPCLGYRNTKTGQSDSSFIWRTYKDVEEAALHVGAGLIHLNLLPLGEQQEKHAIRPIAIFMKNCPEWIIAELGIYSFSGSTVPIYGTLGEENVAHILNETSSKAVLCTATEAKKLSEMTSSIPSVKCIILIGESINMEIYNLFRNANITVYPWMDVIACGKEHPASPQLPSSDNIATFCYTSGTTGPPKGALLTHRNLVSTISSVNIEVKISPSDSHLSYLPLPHVYERSTIHCILGMGAKIGFYQGDARLIPDDLKAIRPTLFPSVPRLLNRMHDKVIAGASKSIVQKYLLKLALAHKAKRMSKAGIQTHWLWDRLIFGKIKSLMGLDRCRMLLSGSAPLAPHVLQFLRSVLAPALVVEGYGQTENCAGATVQTTMTLGDVGPPLCNNEIKLVSVEEMGYFWNDKHHEQHGKKIECNGRGEVWIRGYNVFKGYYNLPNETAETLTSEGWIKTGDVGLWLPNGALKIIDRKKNIFKLSQGEYIAVEKIEDIYMRAKLIEQVFVYGDSYQHNLVAIVVPDKNAVKQWALANSVKLDVSNGAALSGCSELQKSILNQISEISKAAKLSGFEIAKAVHICPEPFSEENGLLTPTFKLKRVLAKKRFAAEIGSLYEGLEGSLKRSVT